MIFHVPVALKFQKKKRSSVQILQFLYIAGSCGQP